MTKRIEKILNDPINSEIIDKFFKGVQSGDYYDGLDWGLFWDVKYDEIMQEFSLDFDNEEVFFSSAVKGEDPDLKLLFRVKEDRRIESQEVEFFQDENGEWQEKYIFEKDPSEYHYYTKEEFYGEITTKLQEYLGIEA